jgi:hypothetical protein
MVLEKPLECFLTRRHTRPRPTRPARHPLALGSFLTTVTPSTRSPSTRCSGSMEQRSGLAGEGNTCAAYRYTLESSVPSKAGNGGTSVDRRRAGQRS